MVSRAKKQEKHIYKKQKIILRLHCDWTDRKKKRPLLSWAPWRLFRKRPCGRGWRVQSKCFVAKQERRGIKIQDVCEGPSAPWVLSEHQVFVCIRPPRNAPSGNHCGRKRFPPLRRVNGAVAFAAAGDTQNEVLTPNATRETRRNAHSDIPPIGSTQINKLFHLQDLKIPPRPFTTTCRHE